MQEFILELAAGDFRVADFNEEVGEKGVGRGCQTAPMKNSGATDGGYFPGRPMEPESRLARTRKAQDELRFKHHGSG